MNDRYTSDYLERDTAFLLRLSLPFQRDERIEKDLSLSISFWPGKISRKRGRGGGGEGASDTHIFREQGWRPRGNFAFLPRFMPAHTV